MSLYCTLEKGLARQQYRSLGQQGKGTSEGKNDQRENRSIQTNSNILMTCNFSYNVVLSKKKNWVLEVICRQFLDRPLQEGVS
jgi:hypothetical protein